MGKVIIASARIDENGKISGGKAGDQTGQEVSTQNYYTHSKGWYGLIAYDYQTRVKIAEAALNAANNNNIGYNQSKRNTLFNVAKLFGFNTKMVDRLCETDCSALVRVCLAYAGIEVPDFNTASEKNILMKTNKFKCVEVKSAGDCKLGMILVTKTKGHTAVVVQAHNDSEEIAPDDSKPLYYVIQRGDTLLKISKKFNKTVSEIQLLNPTKIKDVNKICVGWMIRVK